MTEIKLGEVFIMDGRLYVIVQPAAPTEFANEFGHLVCPLIELDQ